MGKQVKLDRELVEVFLNDNYEVIVDVKKSEDPNMEVVFQVDRDSWVKIYNNGTVFADGEKDAELNHKFGTLESHVKRPKSDRENVFLVFAYKNDEKPKELQLIEKVVTQLGFNPVVMGDESNSGLTLTDKLATNFMDSVYTIVVTTKDEKVKNVNDELYRTRPNVIFELGMAYGRSLEKGEIRKPIAVFDDGVVPDVSDIAGLGWYPFAMLESSEAILKCLYNEFKIARLFEGTV